MSNLSEVLVTCDSNNTLWTSSVWDPHTGNSLMTYRGGGTAEARTLCFIGNDYIVAAEKNKPILHVWPLNSQQTVKGLRFVVPAKVGALAVSPDGLFIVAGINESVSIWQTSSGQLLTVINYHYQKVIQVKFTPDSKFLVTAAEDGIVMVFELTNLIAFREAGGFVATNFTEEDPLYTFNDHSLPVTDLCISKTGIYGRLATVSSDRTCKIYDLSTGEMLLNIIFDVALSSITMDVLDLNLFIGTSEGKIHQFGLTNPPRARDILVNTEDKCPTFVAHTKAVTCLSASLNGEILMSGSNDGQIILWHIQSQQLIRIINHKGPITNAFFTVNFPAIYKQEFRPQIVLQPLEKEVSRDEEEIAEIEIMVTEKNMFWPESRNVDVVSTLPSENIDNEFKIKEAALKKEIEQLKSINANLYTASINKTIASFIPSKKSKKKKQT